MVVICEKTHAETYRDMLRQFSTNGESTQATPNTESIRVTSSAANNLAVPDLALPTAESFGLKLTNRLTSWLRKQAD